jgi:hypothetical protein
MQQYKQLYFPLAVVVAVLGCQTLYLCDSDGRYQYVGIAGNAPFEIIKFVMRIKFVQDVLSVIRSEIIIIQQTTPVFEKNMQS